MGQRSAARLASAGRSHDVHGDFCPCGDHPDCRRSKHKRENNRPVKLVRIAAAVILALIVLACMFPTLVVADASDEQFRNDTDLAPSIRYPLGTDELGRNRLARLLHGTRTSLLLAPAAALTSVTVAALIGLAAGLGGSWSTRLFEASTDL